ncbi:MAG TPA: MBL fold metallo-hydrolase [Acidimicrobiales bacterium]|nr:MBL fold metallo-hydrolase [Acidimicrobiales bacterium]
MTEEGTAPPRPDIELAPAPAAEGGEGESARHGELTFIGTATVLLRFGGFTVLTDPNFLHSGEKADIGLGLRVRRLTEPAMQVGNLPPLDLLVLSHFHGDHFDRTAERDLPRDLPIVTEPHAGRILRRKGFERVVPLETWERQRFTRGERSCSVESLPGRHSPRLLGPVVPPVMGSLLEFADRGRTTLRVYVTGDTLYDERLGEIPARHPEIDLCVIHLGGTRLAGVLLTMDDAQGVRMLELVKPRVAVPVHFDDYAIFRSPLEKFLRRARDTGLSTRVRELRRGETWAFEAGNEEAA